MNSTRPQCPLAPRTTFLPAFIWNTIRDAMPPMFSIPTDIRSRSSIRAREPVFTVNSGLQHGSDVTVLENLASGLPCFPDGDIDHGAGQVVSGNHLIGGQHPKRRVDRAQQPVAEIRFLTRLHGVDIRGPEYV